MANKTGFITGESNVGQDKCRKLCDCDNIMRKSVCAAVTFELGDIIIRFHVMIVINVG